MLFKSFFSESCWSIIKILPKSKNNFLENDNGLEYEAFFECVACNSLSFGFICMVIACFMAFGFLMGVMIISFELPINSYKSLWSSKKD